MMTSSAEAPNRQPCLFETLPTTPPRRPRRARSGTTAPGVEAPPPIIIQVAPVRVDASALTNPELNDLVRALGESSLAFLLVETVREAKRRLSTDDHPDDGDEAEPDTVPSNPALLRAIRTALSDLAESE